MKILIKCLYYLFSPELELTESLYEKFSNSKMFRLLIFTFKRNSFVDATRKASYFRSVFQLISKLSEVDELLDLMVREEDDTNLYS